MSAMDKLFGKKAETGIIEVKEDKPSNPMGLFMSIMKDPTQLQNVFNDMTVFIQTCSVGLTAIVSKQDQILAQQQQILDLLEKKNGGSSRNRKSGGTDNPA